MSANATGANETQNRNETMSIIATARKAIKAALKKNQIERDPSAMHRVAIEAVGNMHHNPTVIAELAWDAVKDVYLA